MKKETKKNIAISLEKAREIYPNADSLIKKLLEEAFGKESLKEMPSCWENLKRIDGFYIDSDSSDIQYFSGYPDPVNKLVFKLKVEAESALAMAQLSQLMYEFNENWSADWSTKDNKYSINCINYELSIVVQCYKSYFLTFPTYEKAETFLKLYKTLIYQYFNGF